MSNDDKPVEIDKNLFVLQNALRPPTQAGIEGLLASELATALFSPPLEKIRHILEAYLLLNKDLRKTIGVDKDDDILYGKIHKLSIDLQNARIHNFGYKFLSFMRVYLPFSFEIEDIGKYLFWIDDYNPISNFGWEVPNPNEMDNYANELCDNSLCIRMVKTYLYGRYGVLSYSSYYDLRNRFISFSMPKALDISQRIFRKLISYDIWSETLALVKGGKYYGRTESKSD